jgi:phospholipid/cholesterol/gamma-HCH transport system permease protein
VACILVLPLLTLAADFCGVLFGWIADTLVEPVSLHRFINQGFVGASFSDFLAPTFRTSVFGLIIGMIGCFQGMRTQGGTAGVGLSATSSVVLSSLFVILADVILVKFILVFFP